MPALRDPLRVRVALSGVAVACLSAEFAARVTGVSSLRVVVWLGFWLTATTAVIACAHRGWRGGQRRVAWLLFAAAITVETLGQAIWLRASMSVRADVSSWADALRVLAAVLFVVGAVRLMDSPLRAQVRFEGVLDFALVVLSLTLLTWKLVLLPGPARAGVITLALHYAHPLGDIAVATAALLIFARVRQMAETASVFAGVALASGALPLAIVDALTSRAALPIEADLGHGLVVAMTASLAMIAHAALTSGYGVDARSPGPHRRERLAVFASIGPVGAGVALCAWYQRAAWRLTGGAGWMLVALALVLLLRLVVALLENLQLSRSLESQVAERTLALLTREQWFRSLVQNSSDVVTVVEPDGTIRYQTPSAARVFGHDPAAMVGTPVTAMLRDEDRGRVGDVLREAAARPRARFSLEYAMWHRDGYWCDTETFVTSLVDDPDIRGLVLNTRDVSERRRLQEQLTRQAFHDELTGLANRVLFHERVARAVDHRRETGQDVAVLFLDLDGFKAVNDSLGHGVGDQLLVLVAERLHHCVRPTDTVARLGGDEFAILVVGRDVESASLWVAERVRAVLSQPFLLQDREVLIAASVGIALVGHGADTADLLLRNADLAMYRAKAQGDGGHVCFQPAMHDALVDQLSLERDLRTALDNGQLVLYYQPTVDLTSGRMVGVEALMRWQHPDRGFLPPSAFIPLAERTGLIGAIGDWALAEACHHAARWQAMAAASEVFRVAVNISGRQLTPHLVTMVSDAVRQKGLATGALVLEMTESVLMERTDEVVGLLRRLKDAGILLAIDDFGTGYSSLSYLARFPVDVLKIDRSFVEELAFQSGEAELARTIVQLGRSLHLGTVAEGVETPTQLRILRDVGCQLGQGFLFSRPVPAAGIDDLLNLSTGALPSLTPQWEPPRRSFLPTTQRPLSVEDGSYSPVALEA